jgi:hypothetical protein
MVGYPNKLHSGIIHSYAPKLDRLAGKMFTRDKHSILFAKASGMKKNKVYEMFSML